MTHPNRPVIRDYDPERVAQLWAASEPERDDQGAVVEIPVFEMPTVYTLSALPEDHDEADFYEIQVEYRREGKWRVRWAGRSLGVDGTWSAGRAHDDDGEWLASHRFDLETALRLAREAAPNLRINRRTVREVVAEIEATP